MAEDAQQSGAGAEGPERDAPTTSEVFASFLSGKLAGSPRTLEQLLAGHPEKAGELRRMHENWSGSQPSDSSASSHPSRASVMDEFASEIIHRLAGRERGFDRYKLEGELARGGQGVIIRVWDEDLSRHLAMKVILSKGAPSGPSTSKKAASTPMDSRSIGRFLEEAQVTGQLDHPGIVPVHELGLDPEGHVYFTMKLVRGRDLRRIIDLVAEGKEDWTVTRALGVLLKVCESMAYAHSKGVMHRDLKPGNIMIGKYGEVFVMDWGLARIVGQDDQKDIRIRPQEDLMSTELHMDHRAAHGDSAESPLITMDGDIVGTPAYMSPEQAMGDLELMGPQSDVYAVGAMLYHLLVGRVPYIPPGARLNNYVIWGLVQTGPPLPIHELAPDVPAELTAICEKAMARDVRQRYADMMELAGDLRAYLEHRVVKAYQTGAVAELKKWVVRNRSLAWVSAAALVLLVGGLAAVGYVEARGRDVAEKERGIALANERLAKDSEAEAKRQEGIALRERANVLRLSAFQNLADLRSRADQLWPVHPDRGADYEAWLAEAATLLEELDFALAQRDELRARALPLDPEEQARSLTLHPRFPELAALRSRHAALQASENVRLGEAQPATFTVDSADAARGPAMLDRQAWPLVNPDRQEYGREAEGLALARLAFELVESDVERARIARTLSFALFANGLHEEALETCWENKDSAPTGSGRMLELTLARLEEDVVAADEGAVAEELARVQNDIAALEGELAGRRLWTFESERDDWWHAQLVKLIAELRVFGDPDTGLVTGISPAHAWGVARRLRSARELEARTVTGDKARALWSEAIASIANPDQCPAYGGLEIEPQLGLLPIGRDKDSGLWEFAHVLSGAVPDRNANHILVLPPEFGVVLVLLPGGTFNMGAQKQDPGKPNFDPAAVLDEGPVHAIMLDPFFLSKFELTQRQWLDFLGTNPSTYAPQGLEWLETGSTGDTHPVEGVSWDDCTLTLWRLGLLIPTEAQWEYAARAGTDTPWWTGESRETLIDAVNFGDKSAIDWGAPWAGLDGWMDDGNPVHAHAQHYLVNPFGLDQMLGNIAEWCRERWSGYFTPWRVGDGQREVTSFDRRVVRGGSFVFPVESTRAAYRPGWEQNHRASFIGVRPSRRLVR